MRDVVKTCSAASLPVVFLALVTWTSCAQFDDPSSAPSLDHAYEALAADTPEPKQREITVATAPFSQCEVALEKDPASKISAQADEEGIVHLWASPTKTSDVYALACDEPSGKAHRKVDLADQGAFLAAKPKVKAAKKTRAALSDPTTVSQEEVIAHGFPPRPNEDSPHYQQWLEMVSTPSTLVDAQVTEGTDHLWPESRYSSPGWSGIALNYPTVYTDVHGNFTVPQFSQQGSGTSKGAIWLGTGGWNGDRALIQTGILSASTGGVTNYKAVYEYYPNAVTVTSFVVNPYDSVYFESWECDAAGNLGGNSHGWGCFYWHDWTRNTSSPIYKSQIPAGVTYLGRTCEAIIERVGSYDLSDWNVTGASVDFGCYDTNYASSNWNVSTDPFMNITSKNGSRTLATAQATNPGRATMWWQAAH